MKFEELKNIDSSIKLIHGNPTDLEISGISHSDAPVAGKFVFVKTKKFLSEVGRRSEKKQWPDSGMLIQEDIASSITEEMKNNFGWIASIKDVSFGMCELSKPFHDELFGELNYQVDGRQMGNVEIDPTAEISQNVFIGSNVTIGAHTKILPGAVILPNVSIGDNTTIFPNVTIYPYCKIGNNCRVHGGTVIGTDGFGYNFYNGKHNKIWHLYGVHIEDDVEIGCNALIDNGAFIPTKIGTGTKIDNNVQISHNVQVGNHVILCGTAGLAGSVEVDDYCVFGGHAGVAPGARLGTGVQVAALSLISENSIIPPHTSWGGYPARPIKEWLKAQAAVRKLIKK